MVTIIVYCLHEYVTPQYHTMNEYTKCKFKELGDQDEKQ